MSGLGDCFLAQTLKGQDTQCNKDVPIKMTVGQKTMGRLGWETVGWHCDFRNIWCQHRSLPVWLVAERKWGSWEKGKNQRKGVGWKKSGKGRKQRCVFREGMAGQQQ